MKRVQKIHHTDRIGIKKSVFIGSCGPITSKEGAERFLQQIRTTFPKAGHYAYAYRLGPTAGYESMSDDREPSGTAGHKILFVMQRREITDTMVIVTRYYGGTPLGRGGLARAYAGACAEVLNQAALQEA